jgi:hypothetical protein
MFPGMIDGTITDSKTWTYQFPCEGNLLVLGIQTKNNNTITSISDSNSNAWAACGSPAKDTSNDHVVEFWFAKNATPSETMTVTPNWSIATGGTPSSSPTVYLIDVTGADTSSPVAQTANANGTSTSHVGSVTAATLSAPAANGLILGFQQEDGETITGVAPGQIISPDIGVYATDGAEKDGGFMAYYPNTNSSVTVTWVYSNYESGTQIGKWVNQLVSFSPASAGGGGSNSLLLLPGNLAGGGELAALLGNFQ